MGFRQTPIKPTRSIGKSFRTGISFLSIARCSERELLPSPRLRQGGPAFAKATVGRRDEVGAQGAFDGLEGVGDAAKEADLAFGEGFGKGDRDGVFMDIESKVECNSLHGVVACSHSHDESERVPRPKRGRSCGSAHPGNPR